MKNAVRFGVPVEEAVTVATVRPARVLGAEAEAGSIAPGRTADFLICDADLTLREVWLGGERIS